MQLSRSFSYNGGMLQFLQRQSTGRLVGYVMLACVSVYLLYFLGLGAYPLTDPDEPVYGQVAKEMASGGGWLTPMYGGHPWFDKPPMFYWVSAISVRTLGLSEAACRLPSALLAIALVLLVYALASYDYGRRAGVLSALVMGTCLQQIVLSHAAVTDMTFVVFLTGALYCYRRWFDAEGHGQLGWGALCGLSTGFAMLTKGPVAPFLLSVAFVIHSVMARRARRLLSASALLAVVTVLAVGVPWYAAMYAIHREKFVEGFLVANNITRFLKAEHAEQTGRWYSCLLNIPVLIAFFFPWSGLLPSAIANRTTAGEGRRLALVWAAVVFVFFSLSKTLLVTYIFPMYPAIALLVGVGLASVSKTGARALPGYRKGLWAALVLAILISGVLVVTARNKCPGAFHQVVALAAVALTMSSAALILAYRDGSMSRAAWTLAGGMVIFSSLVSGAVMPAAAPMFSTRDLVRMIPASSAGSVVSLSRPRESLLYYLDYQPRYVDPATGLPGLMQGDRPVFAVCRRKDLGKVAGSGLQEYARSGDYVLLSTESHSGEKGLPVH